jgi:S1-C subfamily serine protease
MSARRPFSIISQLLPFFTLISGGLRRIAPSVVMIATPRGKLGTGIVVGTKGDSLAFVLTAEHIVNEVGEEEFFNVLYNTNQRSRRPFPAKVERYGVAGEVALISVYGMPSGTTLVTIGKAGKKPDGKLVGTIGNPDSLVWAQSIGAVSKSGGDSIYVNMKLTSGNSGGPLLNNRGEMIGILQQAVTSSEGIAVALKSEAFEPALDDWLDKLGTTQRYAKPFSLPRAGEILVVGTLVVLAGWRTAALISRDDPLGDPPNVPPVIERD